MRPANAKAKRTIIVDVRPSDWHKAEEKWAVLKQNTYSITYTSLRDFQENLWGRVLDNPKDVVGEPVLIIANTDGDLMQNWPYPATILKAIEGEGHLTFRVIYHPIEEEQWSGERIENVKLYQVMPLREQPKARTEHKEQLQFSLLLTRLNSSRNQSITSLRQREEQTLRYISDTQKNLSKYERDLKSYRDQLEGSKGDFLTADDVKENLAQLSKHKYVDWAALTRNGELVVQTKMLYHTAKSSGKVDLSKPIGRFALWISPMTTGIMAHNMDYSRGGYGHMNLSNDSICLGGNSGEVHTMIQTGRFYDLVDFMVLFFSLFPHDAGDGGYAGGHTAWMAERQNNVTSNPWNTGQWMYKVEQEAGAATRESRKKKKPSALERAKKKLGIPTLPEKEAKLKDDEKFVKVGTSTEKKRGRPRRTIRFETENTDVADGIRAASSVSQTTRADNAELLGDIEIPF